MKGKLQEVIPKLIQSILVVTSILEEEVITLLMARKSWDISGKTTLSLISVFAQKTKVMLLTGPSTGEITGQEDLV